MPTSEQQLQRTTASKVKSNATKDGPPIPPKQQYSVKACFVGRDVKVVLRDGNIICGTCVDPGCGDVVKLQNAYTFPGAGFEHEIYPKKMCDGDKNIELFDIVSMAVDLDGHSKKRFATDSEYYRETKAGGNCDLIAWNDDTGGVALEGSNTHTGGWSVDDMFNRNETLGVKSTFKGDLSQYTTCHVEGTREERDRAEQMARDIERNSKNKHLVFLENDDEERDLDKETAVPDDFIDPSKRNNGRAMKGKNMNTKRDDPDMINPRAAGLRSAPQPRNVKMPTQPRGYGKGQAGQNYSNDFAQGRRSHYGDDRRSSPNQKSQANRRTDELRSWSNTFNSNFRESGHNNAGEGSHTNHTGINQQRTQNFSQPGYYGPPRQNVWQKGPPAIVKAPPAERTNPPAPVAPAQAPVQAPAATAVPTQQQYNQPPPPVTKVVRTPQTSPNEQDQPSQPSFTPTKQPSPPVAPPAAATTPAETEQSAKKKFQFNPDAPSFTPSKPAPVSSVGPIMAQGPQALMAQPQLPGYIVANVPGMGMQGPFMIYNTGLVNASSAIPVPQMIAPGAMVRPDGGYVQQTPVTMPMQQVPQPQHANLHPQAVHQNAAGHTNRGNNHNRKGNQANGQPQMVAPQQVQFQGVQYLHSVGPATYMNPSSGTIITASQQSPMVRSTNVMVPQPYMSIPRVDGNALNGMVPVSGPLPQGSMMGGVMMAHTPQQPMPQQIRPESYHGGNESVHNSQPPTPGPGQAQGASSPMPYSVPPPSISHVMPKMPLVMGAQHQGGFVHAQDTSNYVVYPRSSPDLANRYPNQNAAATYEQPPPHRQCPRPPSYIAPQGRRPRTS